MQKICYKNIKIYYKFHSVDINEINEKISFYKIFREDDVILTFRIPKNIFSKSKNKSK